MSGEYRGVNTRKAGRLEELALHPTVKPVAMIADAIKDVSRRGGIVLDLFGGSGSILIAAHKTARRARLCELDPVYCDRILHRWEVFAKDEAELVACALAGRQSTAEPSGEGSELRDLADQHDRDFESEGSDNSGRRKNCESHDGGDVLGSAVRRDASTARGEHAGDVWQKRESLAKASSCSPRTPKARATSVGG